MRRIFTKTFFRFLMAFLIMIAISCSLLIASADAASRKAAAASILGFLTPLEAWRN